MDLDIKDGSDRSRPRKTPPFTTGQRCVFWGWISVAEPAGLEKRHDFTALTLTRVAYPKNIRLLHFGR